MRRGILVALAAVLLVPAMVLAAPQAGPGDRQEQSSGFPSCVAGAYLGEVTLDVGLVFQNLSTLGADGTYVTESTIDFSAGGTVPMAFRGGGRGQWRMIGPRQMKITYLHFAFDAAGVLVWLEKITVVATASRGCASATGEAIYAIYPPGSDPFGDEPPMAEGSATLVMKRLPLD